MYLYSCVLTKKMAIDVPCTWSKNTNSLILILTISLVDWFREGAYSILCHEEFVISMLSQ